MTGRGCLLARARWNANRIARPSVLFPDDREQTLGDGSSWHQCCGLLGSQLCGPPFSMSLSSAAIAAVSATALDPFAFFRPSIAVSADDRRELDRGQSIAHVVRGADREIAVFAAIQVSIDGDRLVTWMRDIGELKKSPHVLAIGRFSDPPTIQDLDRLTLDEGDLSAIRRCQRGDCGLKLAGAEMDRLRQSLAEAGDNWKPVLQDAFRQIVLQRVEGYLANGHAALRGYEDKDGPLSLEARFSSLLNRSFFLTGATPRFAEYLDQYRTRADLGGGIVHLLVEGAPRGQSHHQRDPCQHPAQCRERTAGCARGRKGDLCHALRQRVVGLDRHPARETRIA